MSTTTVAILTKAPATDPVPPNFLATYKVASSVITNELLHLFSIVHHRNQAPKLAWVLVLAHKVPEDRAVKKELASLKDVIKCVADHGLELEYPPGNLETRINSSKGKRKSGNYQCPHLNRNRKALKRCPAQVFMVPPVVRSQLKELKKRPLWTAAPKQYLRPASGQYSLAGSTPASRGTMRSFAANAWGSRPYLGWLQCCIDQMLLLVGALCPSGLLITTLE
ncbi:hypothetical protein RJ639_043553 [Escallonia herrerae]|uniref:FRIGIDA-like protein n=1 Tax=Escallonia herrerae TaxID=1293975 RepID=A0AA89B3M0_9ASTE|nr:hypothetical protein RJ639_043553 [Escallonia herrerae]